MEQTVEETYKKAKSILTKSIVLVLVLYFLFLFVVFLIEKIFMNFDLNNFLTIILSAVFSLITASVYQAISVLNLVKPFNKILIDKCDAEQFLKYTEYAVNFGIDKTSKLEKNLFHYFQYLFVQALVVNRRYEDALRYIEVIKNTNSKSKQIDFYEDFILASKAFSEENSKCFDEFLKKYSQKYRNNNLVYAQSEFLKHNYDSTVEIINNNKETSLYNKVVAEYLKSISYLRKGNFEKAKQSYLYVMENANNLPLKKDIEKIFENV